MIIFVHAKILYLGILLAHFTVQCYRGSRTVIPLNFELCVYLLYQSAFRKMSKKCSCLYYILAVKILYQKMSQYAYGKK